MPPRTARPISASSTPSRIPASGISGSPAISALAPNHNYMVDQARGELFKWAAGDDLYARDLLGAAWTRWTSTPRSCWPIPGHGHDRRHRNGVPGRGVPAVHLVAAGAGAFPQHAVRRRRGRRRRHHADRGAAPDRQERQLPPRGPDDHFRADPARARSTRCPTGCTSGATTPSGPSGPTRACGPGARTWTPAGRDKLRHPAVRLYGEYIWAYLRSIHQAPISAADKRECYRYLWEWAASRARSRHPGQAQEAGDGRAASINVDELVAGREGSMSDPPYVRSARGRRSPAAPRVGLFGLLGSGNIGNDASMESILGYLRARHPAAVVDAMCMGPDQLTARYGLRRHPPAVGQAVRGPPRRRAVRRGPGAGQGPGRGPDGPLGAPARRGDRPGHGRAGGEPPAARLGSAVRDVPAVRGRAADRHQGRAGQRRARTKSASARPGSSSTPPPGWRTTGPTGTPSPGRR